ncbi:hypothetical protein AK812_SmicGene29244 [Symbiodinium microadriaticum]|uniref:Uncharacterized protein n=1 Tax=Symbiodinium microadriaticum TaxID=2951 RepID=A0A1Q9D2C4_SYMMI|nr:hypothetical protein AK812_SmicGene29244 [Symbiodinium microadriaticum]
MSTTAEASCTVNTQDLKRKYDQIKSDQLQEKPKMLLQKLSEAFVDEGHTEKGDGHPPVQKRQGGGKRGPSVRVHLYHQRGWRISDDVVPGVTEERIVPLRDLVDQLATSAAAPPPPPPAVFTEKLRVREATLAKELNDIIKERVDLLVAVTEVDTRHKKRRFVRRRAVSAEEREAWLGYSFRYFQDGGAMTWLHIAT